MVVLLVLMMMVSFIWTLKNLAVISMIGNVFVVLGLTSITIYIITNISFQDLDKLFVKDYTEIPNFISIAVFAFEAIGNILLLNIFCFCFILHDILLRVVPA